MRKKKQCSECDQPSRLRGYCRSCYGKAKQQGKVKRLTPAEQPREGHLLTQAEYDRFLAQIDKRGPDECWPWTGVTDRKQYGWVKIRRLRESFIYVTRISLAMWKGGDLFGDDQACHHCDNPVCVNPEHLFWGTQKQNMEDAVRKGRSAYGEKNGQAVLTEEIVLWIHRQKGIPHSQIAVKLSKVWGVHVKAPAVSRILSGARWGHLHPEELQQ